MLIRRETLAIRTAQMYEEQEQEFHLSPPQPNQVAFAEDTLKAPQTNTNKNPHETGKKPLIHMDTGGSEFFKGLNELQQYNSFFAGNNNLNSSNYSSYHNMTSGHHNLNSSGGSFLGGNNNLNGSNYSSYHNMNSGHHNLNSSGGSYMVYNHGIANNVTPSNPNSSGGSNLPSGKGDMFRAPSFFGSTNNLHSTMHSGAATPTKPLHSANSDVSHILGGQGLHRGISNSTITLMAVNHAPSNMLFPQPTVSSILRNKVPIRKTDTLYLALSSRASPDKNMANWYRRIKSTPAAFKLVEQLRNVLKQQRRRHIIRVSAQVNRRKANPIEISEIRQFLKNPRDFSQVKVIAKTIGSAALASTLAEDIRNSPLLLLTQGGIDSLEVILNNTPISKTIRF